MGLRDTQSCSVYVQMSSRGNSAERLIHGTVVDMRLLFSLFHSCGQPHDLCQQISYLCLNSFGKYVSSEPPV